jgi:O-antigen/teichoic acid export membrane protein
MSSGNRFGAGGLLFVGAATMVANAASYVLSIVAARALSVPDYGALGAMLSISIIGGTAALALQAVGARRVAAAQSGRAEVTRQVATLSYQVTCYLMVGAFLLAWPFSLALAVPYWAVFLTFGSIAASILGFSALGAIQGHERNVGFGIAYTAIATLRAGGGVLAMLILPDITFACLGIFLGSVAGSAVSMWVARYPKPGKLVPRTLVVELGGTMIALIGLFALSNMDVLLARLFLDSQASGEYAVGALIAKIAFFLPSAIIAVSFPRMSASPTKKASLVAVVMTAAVGGIVTGSTVLLSEPILWVLGGEKYLGLGEVAWLFALEGAIFAVAQVVLYVGFSSQNKGVALMVWVALACQLTFVVLFYHDSIVEIVTSTAVIAAILTVAGFWWEFRKGLLGSIPQTVFDPVDRLPQA